MGAASLPFFSRVRLLTLSCRLPNATSSPASTTSAPATTPASWPTSCRPTPEQADGFDHLEFSQGWNAYAYVHNGPLNSTDPDGLDCIYTSNQTLSSVSVTIERGACTTQVVYSSFNAQQQTGGAGDIFLGDRVRSAILFCPRCTILARAKDRAPERLTPWECLSTARLALFSQLHRVKS